MNQSEVEENACNGYQARENSQPVSRAGKLASGLNLILVIGWKETRFLIGYIALHDIFRNNPKREPK